MKNLVRILSLTLVVVMLCMTLASCGLSGTYKADLFGAEVTYEFGLFGKVTATYKMGDLTNTIEGKYKVEDDKLIITYEKDGTELKDEAKFEKTDAGIKIDGVEYKKQ